MYSKYQFASRWFQFIIRASNGKGHGIHSPFVYKLIREVLNDDHEYDAYKFIETVKKDLLQENRIIQVDDFGAGSSQHRHTGRKISAIARKSVSDQKFGRLLFRLAHFYKAGNIVELGSSLGISSAYLASADVLSHVYTLEGSPEIAAIARETHQKLKLQNITRVTGKFEETLSAVISMHPPVDLVFIDGNHRKKAVLEYFEQFLQKISAVSMIIIHDIHWSREMEEAWAEIQADPRVKLSIDIFSAGLVFFRDEFMIKQQFLIRF